MVRMGRGGRLRPRFRASLVWCDTWEEPYPERMFSWALPLSAAHVPKAAKAWIAV